MLKKVLCWWPKNETPALKFFFMLIRVRWTLWFFEMPKAHIWKDRCGDVCRTLVFHSFHPSCPLNKPIIYDDFQQFTVNIK